MEDMLVVEDDGKSSPSRPREQDIPVAVPARPRLRSRSGGARAQGRLRVSPRCSSGFSALLSLVLGLSMLAALPIVQFLSLGYFLESSARVARSGRMRDGFVGVRRAARVGGITAGIWVCLVPTWLAGLYARSAELINPGGTSLQLAIALIVVTRDRVAACRRLVPARGGRIRHFLWPFGHPFWLVRRLRQDGRRSVRRGSRQALGVRGEPYAFRIISGWAWSAFLARLPGWPFPVF